MYVACSKFHVPSSQYPHPQAIYPTVIIILVALNRSYIDKPFTESDIDRLPAFSIRPSLLALGPDEISLCDVQQDHDQDRVDVMSRTPGDGQEPHESEEFSTHTVGKQEMECGHIVYPNSRRCSPGVQRSCKESNVSIE